MRAPDTTPGGVSRGRGRIELGHVLFIVVYGYLFVLVLNKVPHCVVLLWKCKCGCFSVLLR